MRHTFWGARLTRRQTLGLTVAGATCLAAGSAGWILHDSGPGAGAEPKVTGAELHQPEILDSRNGRLTVELVAGAGVSVAGRTSSALGYNGATPGPTIRVRPGDELALRLTNKLAQPTNLHTHGLRVSPAGNSDNPFVVVDPGASFDYLIKIPDDHPTGTFWYHPHHHGTAADQQFGGLAGALLVVPKDTGAPSVAPDLATGQDVVLVITDITLGSDGTVSKPSGAERTIGREGALVLVNGQHQPVLAAAPGSTGRWRIINACTSRVLAVRLGEHKLTQIALDGTSLIAPVERDVLVLAPGNRADVLVQAGGPGRYELVADPYDRGQVGGHSAGSTRATLAALLVTGNPVAPVAARPPAADAPPSTQASPTRFRQIGFTMAMAGGRMAFSIDNKRFDPARDDQTVALGTTEVWFITNYGPLMHPFHLHAWPFVVLAGSDGAPPSGVPQDVVLVPARGWVRIRIAFTGYPGRSVYHCHVVDHSDAGMMATVVVA